MIRKPLPNEQEPSDQGCSFRNSSTRMKKCTKGGSDADEGLVREAVAN